MKTGSKIAESETSLRKMWACYLVCPCVFFYAMATRLPLIVLALYSCSGLNLKPHMGVLAVVTYSLGRVVGATLLSQKEISPGRVIISSSSSVVAFTAIMLIPAFPSTKCNSIGFNCFKEDGNHFGVPRILVSIWYFFWAFISGFAETITTLDHALSLEIGAFLPEIRQKYFRTVMVSATFGSMIGYAASSILLEVAGLWGSAGLGLFAGLCHTLLMMYYFVFKKRHLESSLYDDPNNDLCSVETLHPLASPSFYSPAPLSPRFESPVVCVGSTGERTPFLSVYKSPVNKMDTTQERTPTEINAKKFPLMPSDAFEKGLNKHGFSRFTFLDYLHVLRVANTNPYSNKIMRPQLAEEMQWSQTHEMEITLMKWILAYFLAFGATGITSILICFPLFMKGVWSTPNLIPGLIMATGEMLGLITLGLSICFLNRDATNDRGVDGKAQKLTKAKQNCCTQNALQQPILFVIFTIITGTMCAILGFVKPDEQIQILKDVTDITSSYLTASAPFLGRVRFWFHATAAAIIGLSNVFLHSSGVEVMNLYLPQDVFFYSLRLGYGFKRVVNGLYGLLCFGLFTLSPHAPYLFTAAFLFMIFFPCQLWVFAFKFQLIPCQVETKHKLLEEILKQQEGKSPELDTVQEIMEDLPSISDTEDELTVTTETSNNGSLANSDVDTTTTIPQTLEWSRVLSVKPQQDIKKQI